MMNIVLLIVCNVLLTSSQENRPVEERQNYSSYSLTSVPRSLPLYTVLLDVSDNNISQLKRDDFSEMPALKFLNLSHNNIKEISDDIFKSNMKLEYLNLSHNELYNISCGFLVHVTELKVLDISNNKFALMTLGSVFGSMEKLEYLSLSAETLQRHELKHIKSVWLKKVFLGFNNLLDNEYEKTDTITIVLKSKYCIDYFNDKTDCYVGFALRQRKANFKVTSLTLIDVRLSWQYLINQTLQPSIKHLNVHNLNITGKIIPTNITKNTSLETLKINRGTISTFIFLQNDLYNFFINRVIKNLTIDNTPIVHMTCPYKTSTLKQLDFSSNAFSDGVFSSTREPICKTLTNLNTLILMGNKLEKLHQLSVTTKYMKALKYLDASTNSLTYEFGDCTWTESIIALNVSSNSLDHLVFKCLPRNTQILDLQNNQIASVPEDMVHLEALKELYLGSNRLLDIPDCNSFRKLEMLFIDANSLHTPSIHFLSSCKNLRVFHAGNNPFMCTCSLRDFAKIKEQSRIEFIGWPDAYSCSYPEAFRGISLKDFHVPEMSCNLTLLLVTILCPMIVITIAIAVLCIHCDALWYMRMMWQWTQTKRRVKANRCQKTPEGLMYNAFVSYSQLDSIWVKEYLLPNLEEDKSVQICLHERDFIPGKSIIENIISCIEKSYKSIFVLSPNFIQSEWCHYELYFAHHQLLTANSDHLILILLEPISQYMIPSKYYKLKALMAKRTYFKWPKDKNKHKLFWAHLRAAIQIHLAGAAEDTAESKL
ncbi:toll-like receptor 1 [Polyodon spathula]|uniref:toll-like receptor 1 n=1 Tax=Polyodon spathula TaxID=7913 RepID=UPI001B7EFCDA|nr:toll-like receptor 1 [Polyodon spathula]